MSGRNSIGGGGGGVSISLEQRTLVVRGIDGDKLSVPLLEELFANCGPVVNVVLRKTHAFIEYTKAESVGYALAMLDGITLYGVRLRLSPKLDDLPEYYHLRDNLREYERRLAADPSYIDQYLTTEQLAEKRQLMDELKKSSSKKVDMIRKRLHRYYRHYEPESTYNPLLVFDFMRTSSPQRDKHQYHHHNNNNHNYRNHYRSSNSSRYDQRDNRHYHHDQQYDRYPIDSPCHSIGPIPYSTPFFHDSPPSLPYGGHNHPPLPPSPFYGNDQWNSSWNSSSQHHSPSPHHLPPPPETWSNDYDHSFHDRDNVYHRGPPGPPLLPPPLPPGPPPPPAHYYDRSSASSRPSYHHAAPSQPPPSRWRPYR